MITETVTRGPIVRAAERPAPFTAMGLATNFAGAMVRWVKVGLPVVTAEQHAQRMAVCNACEHWDGASRLGLGTCKAPGCGCSQFKHWLATERCVKNKWPQLPTDDRRGIKKRIDT
jgi:hypothetical protein